MNAVILAGGFGSRLKPLTESVPKPMLPIANQPMLDYVIAHLSSVGIQDVVLTLGYMPEQIERWTSGYGSVSARYVTEDVPLGTAGGVRAAHEYLDDRFIVLSGDALENIDLSAMLARHVHSGKAVTMAVTRVDDPRSFGLVEYDDTGTVTSFREKPDEFVGEGVVNCGVYILERAVLKRVPSGEKYDFSRDLFPSLVAEGQIGVYRHDGFWSDIGSPHAYYKANFAMMGGAFYARPYNRYRTESHVIGGENASLAAYSAIVSGKCRNSVIGECAAIATDAHVEDCIILPYCTAVGTHYGEIIGDGYSLPIPYVSEQLQDSTRIYKNFS